MSIRVAIVHDYLTQRGGAERVVLSMLRCFPGADVYTAVYNPESTYSEFKDHRVITTGLNRYRPFRTDPRRALPFLAHAMSNTVVENVDVVLASTSGWAHAIRSTAPVVAYCHTPARWLYEDEAYFRGVHPFVRRSFGMVSPALRRWDRLAADRVTTYVANSSVVQQRIARAYGFSPEIVFPPSCLDHGDEEPVPGVEPGFLLTVGRRRGYKNTDVVCEAVAEHTTSRLVVVGELPGRRGTPWPDRIVALPDVSDAQLRWLYSRSAGVVAMSHEDFGLTPIEGFQFGVPALALGAGGYLDSCGNEAAAVLVPSLDPRAIGDGVRALETRSWDREAIQAHAKSFHLDYFGQRMESILRAAAKRERALPTGDGRDSPVPGPASPSVWSDPL